MLVELTRSFEAMNTSIQAAVCLPAGSEPAGRHTLEQVECLFNDAEQTLSRFDPNTELSQMNSQAFHPFPASPILFKVVDAAVA